MSKELIPQFSAHQNDLDASLFPLTGTDQIVATDTGIPVAPGGHAAIQPGTASQGSAGGLTAEAHRIGGGGHPLDTLDSLVQILDDLVVPGHHNHGSGTIADGCHPIAVAVHIV